MSIVITDKALLEQFIQAADTVEVHDANGNYVGMFSPPPDGKLPPGVQSPFTEEEMELRRKHREGRPLADILRDLEKRG